MIVLSVDGGCTSLRKIEPTLIFLETIDSLDYIKYKLEESSVISITLRAMGIKRVVLQKLRRQMVR